MNNNIIILIGIFLMLVFASGCSLIAPEEQVYIAFDSASDETARTLNISITTINSSSISDEPNSNLNKLYNSYLNGSINYTNSSNGINVSYPGGRARIYIGGGGSSGGSSASSSSSSDEQQSSSQSENEQPLNETYNQTESNLTQNQSTSESSDNNETNNTQNNSINETEKLINDLQGNQTQYNETQPDDNYNNSQENEDLDDQEVSEDEYNEELQEIPEFTTITAALVLIGAGYFLHRKRSGKI